MATLDPSTYKTGNPVPSNKAEDLSDNARVFDVFLNDKAGDSVLDRNGSPIPTIAKALQNASWVDAGEWSTNPTATESNQYFSYAGTNQRFRPMSLPYTVDSTTNPDPNTLLGTELVDVSNFLSTERLTEYTDLSFININALLSDTPIKAPLGSIVSTGGTTWKRTSFSNPTVIADFEAITPVNVKDYGSDGAALNWANELPYDLALDGEFTSDEIVFFTREGRTLHCFNEANISFTSAPAARVLTDRAEGGDSPISVGVIFGARFQKTNGRLKITATTGMHHSGIWYPNQSADLTLDTSGSSGGFIIDATGSDRNTYLSGLVPEVTFTGGSNECNFQNCNFIDGFGVIGTDRNPDDYTSATWLWSWAGVSDLTVKGSRIEGLKLDAAMKNTAKSIQSIAFIGGSIRQGDLVLDRCNRVSFIGMYGESASDAFSTTENTGQVMLIASGFQHTRSINANTDLVDIDWFTGIQLRKILIDGAQCRPTSAGGASLGSSSIYWAEVNVARVNTDRIETLIGSSITLYDLLLTNNNLRPQSDGAYTLGTSSYRYNTINLINQPSVTSDARYKNIGDISEAEIRVSEKIRKIKFQYNESIEKKGNGARWHFGYSAQQIIDSFESEGLNPFDYAMLRKVPLNDEFDGDISTLNEGEFRYEVLVDQVNAFKGI